MPPPPPIILTSHFVSFISLLCFSFSENYVALFLSSALVKLLFSPSFEFFLFLNFSLNNATASQFIFLNSRLFHILLRKIMIYLFVPSSMLNPLPHRCQFCLMHSFLFPRALSFCKYLLILDLGLDLYVIFLIRLFTLCLCHCLWDKK